ncbi:hypothetical protein LAZ67_4000948 [Cordylochernes scorpioides]|uniref:Reverse transcriptase domain-containing protein n=1 Tax=Cordylochernes scorpioides TaxID=51811 RepID=A0ABY6KGC4_9ARAC|nr:hypothetical protein LAZ67_4000948 [Cordylochernes scorpioides]
MEDEILNKNFDDDSETENYSLNESSDVSTDEECDSILTTVQMSSSNCFIGKNGYKWNKNHAIIGRTRSHNIITHLPGLKGPAKPKPNCSIDIFNLFFTAAIIKQISEFTNAKIEEFRQRISDLTKSTYSNFTSEIEIRAFLGLLYLAGVYKSGHENVESLFASDGTGRDIFRSVMSVKRFLFLLLCIRFDNFKTRCKVDRLSPIRDIFQTIIEKFQSCYTPAEYLTVDEMLVGFRGKCPFKIYIPSKPNKYGIKIVILADSRTHYMYNAMVYTGKSKTPKSKELSLPTQIVLDISRPLWKSNRNITADNWFTSIELVDKLKEHGLTYLGTMRKNKPQIPPQFQPHPKRESGTSIFGFSGTKTLVSYVPKKKKIRKPDIIMDYNLTKGSVDTIDQMVSNFSTSCRSRRWPLALFYALLDITALNSYIIFNYQIDKKDQKERSTFIVDLGRSLIDEHLATRNLNSLPLELQTTIKKFKNNDGSSTSRGSTMPQESDTPKSAENPITHTLPRLHPAHSTSGLLQNSFKVDRMTEDNDMQRMTEAGNEYFADALTNIQPHYEDLVSRLTDSIRGLAIPRVEETLISPFDGSYAANNFIQQLERTSEGPQDDATLQARLRTLLKGEPLSLYNELNLASLPYSQAKQTLIDLYPGKSEVTFTKFLTFKLNNQIQLGEYYRQKITKGLQLGLTNPIIVEALTEGLQASDQRLMRAIAPKTLTEWYSTMNRIKGTNSLPTSSEPLQGVTNTSAFHRDTRTPSRGRNYNTFSPNNTLRYPSGARKPPSPCKYCQGDHWNNECSMNRLPYRQQAYHGQPTAHSFPPEQNVAHNLPSRADPQNIIKNYPNIFSTNKYNIPKLKIPPINIRTKSDKIIALRPYRTSLSDQREIQEQVEKMLEYDIIEPSFSPYSSPVTLVTKKDKTKRFCVDYRRLNEIIVPDVHPLPLIENILDKLANAKIYSRADFSSAYWSIEISPPDRNLLSFVTLEGQYNFKRLPYGIKIGPQVYERAVSQILQRNRLGFIAHYFDDFIIFSNSIEEHLDHLQQFFDMCNRENFRLNYNKCDFFKTTIEFLGYTISSGTYTPLVKNLDVINAIKVPTSVKSLQSFLGSINVYNKFIKDHARIRNPLNNLLKKNTPWHWDAKCQHSFDTLKECLTTKPVLHLFKEGLPCQLFCDASLQGIAGILKQQHPDGTLHPVQYYSRALRPHEKNYTITELECLAVIDSVEKFRIYLAGVRFTIFTDHHALQWLKTIKNPTGRLFRWSLKMSAYEYDIKYIKGKTQYEADLLSRNPLCGFLTTTQIIEKQPQLPPSTLIKTNIDGLHTIKRKAKREVDTVAGQGQTIETKINPSKPKPEMKG